ncbi:hypothetical protein [Picosynechococcus sp. NKBG042902]|uniref:hypothetical protein n=1 Tax=Picosynechococcus sp. NKBG042902 TaxID=490193 RepID=UPI0004AACAB8|nr:hypothetical protein [Picosynechococcus sp. NKBG042902]
MSPTTHATGQDPEVQLQRVCTQAYEEPLQLLWWEIADAQGSLKVICREQRRGYYVEVLLHRTAAGYQPSHGLVAAFATLLKPDPSRWENLTKRATATDWQALDRLWFYALTIPDSEILWGDETIIGITVAEKAIARFGYAVPDPSLLPVLIFENRALGLNLISYVCDPDHFAGENLLYDHHTHRGEAYPNLFEAQIRLKQKLDAYFPG